MTMQQFSAFIDHYAASQGQPPPIIVVYLGPNWMITGEWQQASSQHLLVLHVGTGISPIYVPLSSIVAISAGSSNAQNP